MKKILICFSLQLLLKVSRLWKTRLSTYIQYILQTRIISSYSKSWICVVYSVQMASSEWVLGLQIQHFANLYNAEIRGDQYCCCDMQSTAAVPCVDNLPDLQSSDCTAECEPYFEIYFIVCFTNETCFVMKHETFVLDGVFATCIGPPLVQLYSNESMFDSVHNVSAKRVCNKMYARWIKHL